MNVLVQGAHPLFVLDYIGALVKLFVRLRKRGAVRTEQALTAFPRNDYVSDLCFWSSEKSLDFVGDTTIYPIPDLICEILSPATEARDRGVKFEDYAAHGVAEYWIVDPELRIIEQYIEREGKYELAGKFTDGMIRGHAIDWLVLPVSALLEDSANLTAMRELLDMQ